MVVATMIVMALLKQSIPSKRAWDRRYDKNSGEEEDRSSRKEKDEDEKKKDEKRHSSVNNEVYSCVC